MPPQLKTKNELGLDFRFIFILCIPSWKAGYTLLTISYNAEEIWHEKDDAREIRTVADIKIDNEMTINYAYPTISLKNFKT
jgi:hypothetical protein